MTEITADVGGAIWRICLKFRKIRTYGSSRSSKVIDLGVNRKPIYDFLLVTNSNFGRICCTAKLNFALPSRLPHSCMAFRMKLETIHRATSTAATALPWSKLTRREMPYMCWSDILISTTTS